MLNPQVVSLVSSCQRCGSKLWFVHSIRPQLFSISCPLSFSLLSQFFIWQASLVSIYQSCFHVPQVGWVSVTLLMHSAWNSDKKQSTKWSQVTGGVQVHNANKNLCVNCFPVCRETLCSCSMVRGGHCLVPVKRFVLM